MLLHCCGVPSPRSLQDPPEIRKTMDVSVLSHFWVGSPRNYKKTQIFNLNIKIRKIIKNPYLKNILQIN